MIHVNHGLRKGSAAEADIVAAASARFGAEFRSETVRVEPGPNLEARARAARYSVLPADVMTGHTVDDQAETVLLNLLRGSGLSGLAGIRDDGRRPLLKIRRSETHRLCKEMGLAPVNDLSNADPRFRRNRLRHELLPLLNDIAQRDVAAVIARQAELIGADGDLLMDMAAAIDPSDAHNLIRQALPLARLAVREWLRPTNSGHPPDAAAVERVLAVARNEAVATDVGNGWEVRRSANRLRLVAPIVHSG